jgi:hypothetical protein
MNKIKIIRKYLAAYNTFNIENMLVNLSDDVIFINISNSEKDTESTGKDEFKDLAIEGAKFFTNRQQKIDDWQEDDDKVLCHIAFKATLTDEACKQLNTEQNMRLKGTSEFHFDNGKISKIIDRS